MQSLVLGDLTIEAVERERGLLELHWTGASNNADPGASLRPWLHLALAEAVTRTLRLDLHFEKLKHFNSSTIAALLLFAQEAAQRQVQVTFHYDGSQRWQAHSFTALARMTERTPGISVVRHGQGPAAETVGDP